MARYGVEGGRDESAWWRELVHIRSRVGLQVESWFVDNLWRRLVMGLILFFFWTDPLVEGFLCM